MAFQAEPPGFGGYLWSATPWARWNSLGDPRFRVFNSAALAPTINTGAARSITVAAGDIDCCGISGTNSPETVAFDANTGTNDRYDALVARVNWLTKTVSLAVVQGPTNGTLPPINQGSSVVNSSINWIPGTQYDGVIAIVKVPVGVGTFGPSNLDTDCRLWGSSGGLVAPSAARLSVLDVPEGSSVLAGGTRYWRQSGAFVSTSSSSLVVGHGLSTTNQTFTTGPIRLVNGLPFSCSLIAGRAYHYTGFLRCYGTNTDIADTTAAEARAVITPSAQGVTFNDTIITGTTAPVRKTTGAARYPLPLNKLFRVSSAGTFIVSIWGNSLGDVGDVTFTGDVTGAMHHQIVDMGPAPSSVPVLTP